MDFGLKTFLTLSDGTSVKSPLFLKRGLKELARKQRAHDRAACRWSATSPDGSHPKDSRIVWESNHRKKLAGEVAACHAHIAHARNDWQWKQARKLCERYDIICIEDLNIKGMKKLWGRKVSDLAFSKFVQKLECEAYKYGCEVRKIDRFYASSKTCHVCGYKNEGLTLRDRQWVCPECGAVLDRDMNAAVNILSQGTGQYRSSSKTKIILRKARMSL